MNRYDTDSRVHPSACFPLDSVKKASASTTLFFKFFGSKSRGFTAFKKLVLENETPGYSVFNMYINHFGIKHLIHMV